MRRSPAALENTTFDAVVIGGGITGACIAHDAALRGLSVALIEQGDFGGATSAASSKLLHGGIRHLQQLRVDKVRESARERSHFRRIAPHLSRWVPFLVPTDRTFRRGRWFLGCGMELYALLGGADELSGASGPPSGTWLDRAALGRVAPLIADCEAVTGALVLNECHLHSSERMTLAFVKTAVAHGASAANYVAADGLLRDGSRVVGVRARDVERGDEFPIRARVTVNAAGPWLPGLNDRFAVGALRRPVTAMAMGAHIVTRQVMGGFAAALSTGRASAALVGRGGRHVFVIPWRGHSLIGTSNRRFQGEPAAVEPTKEDVADLVGDVNRAIPSAPLAPDDVRHAFAGLYPLTAARIDPVVYQGAADYQIVDHGRHGGAEGALMALVDHTNGARDALMQMMRGPGNVPWGVTERLSLEDLELLVVNLHDLMQVVALLVIDVTARNHENTYEDRLTLAESRTKGVNPMQGMERIAQTTARRLRDFNAVHGGEQLENGKVH